MPKRLLEKSHHCPHTPEQRQLRGTRCTPELIKAVEVGYRWDMTNELNDGDHIIELTSAGPKNYGFKTTDGKDCCKVRGFSLNVRGSQQLNYGVMKQNLLDEIRNPLDERRNIDVNEPNYFHRSQATKHLKVIPRIKRYGLVFDKRVVDPDTFKSYPYGFTRVTAN